MGKSPTKKLLQINTEAGEETIHQAAVLRQDDVYLRINGVNLQGTYYHKECRDSYVAPRNLLKFSMNRDVEDAELSEKSEKSFATFRTTFEKKLRQGVAMELSTLRELYNGLLQQAEVDEQCDNRKIKKILTSHYGQGITFQDQQNRAASQLVFASWVKPGDVAARVGQLQQQLNNPCITLTSLADDSHADQDFEAEFLRSVTHTATRIRADMKLIPKYTGYEGIGREQASKMVPKSLYIMLKAILSSQDDDPSSSDDDVLHDAILSIGQDIIYRATKKDTPKHIGIAMAVHQATRSKELIQLLHGAGDCISYDQLMRIETSLAKVALERLDSSSGLTVFIPPNLVPGRFVHFAADNIDILEDTLNGSGTFHGTQMAAFQCRFTGEPYLGSQKAIPRPSSQKSLTNVPDALNELIPLQMTKKPAPLLRGGDVPGDKSCCQGTFNTKDLIWLMCRNRKHETQKIPAWTGFNQLLSDVKTPQSITGYMPIIPAPAHELDTVWTALLRSRQVARCLGLQKVVITFDQALYFKAVEVIWLHPELQEEFVIRLGGFHTASNFLRCIGQHFEDSGLKDVWVEAGVLSDNSATKVLEAKSWNRAIRTHKLTFEALWRCLWPQFLQWCEDHGRQLPEDTAASVFDVTSCLEDGRNTAAKTAAQNLLTEATIIAQHLQAFEEARAHEPMTTYWLEYMKMTSTVLSFIRAERDGCWELHLKSFRQMLPWFHVYDHNNYARWGPVYLRDMQLLPTTAPEVYEEFKEGRFAVSETGQPFTAIAADQALEHVNRAGKVAGGLVGISRTPTALNRWSLTYNDRATLSAHAFQMFDVAIDASQKSKDIGTNRINRDEEDVVKLMHQFHTSKVRFVLLYKW